jgi:hypothetical protein
MFSLETGEEILTFSAKKGQGNFPYKTSQVAFEPRLMALCPSQRVIAFGGPDDSRVELNFFHHVVDGIDEELPESLELHPQPTNDYLHYKNSLMTATDRRHLSKPEELLKKVSCRTIQVHPVEPDEERKLARAEAKRAVEYVWEVFLVALEKRDDAARRRCVAEDVYGANTGLGLVRILFYWFSFFFLLVISLSLSLDLLLSVCTL